MSKVLILANSSSGLYDFRNELLLRLLQEGHEVLTSLPDDARTKETTPEGLIASYLLKDMIDPNIYKVETVWANPEILKKIMDEESDSLWPALKILTL